MQQHKPKEEAKVEKRLEENFELIDDGKEINTEFFLEKDIAQSKILQDGQRKFTEENTFFD